MFDSLRVEQESTEDPGGATVNREGIRQSSGLCPRALLP